LHRDFWGKGYTVEASLPLLRFGFEELGLHRIFAQCVAVNRGSARVMEKLGMQFEGRSRESFLLDGVWYDDLKYAILEQEWRALYPSVPTESA
jgi:RimJ/RimL family protein N-acetyltransferase